MLTKLKLISFQRVNYGKNLDPILKSNHLEMIDDFDQFVVSYTVSGKLT